MTILQQVLTVAAVVLGTMTTRFLPFLLFPEGKQPPAFIRYLGTVLPSAVIGLLVVFCLKDAVFTSWHRPAGAFGHSGRRFAAPVEEKYSPEHCRRNHFLYGPGSDGFLIPALTKHAARPGRGSFENCGRPCGVSFFIVYFERASRAPSPAGKDESPWPPRFPDG